VFDAGKVPEMFYSSQDAQVVSLLVAETIHDRLAHRRRERPSLVETMRWAWGAGYNRPPRLQRRVVRSRILPAHADKHE